MALVVVATTIFLTSCSEKEDKISTPPELTSANADWIIELYPTADSTNGNDYFTYLYVSWEGNPYSISATDSVSLSIDSQNIHMPQSANAGEFRGTAMLQMGVDYNIKLHYNGVQKISTKFKTINRCAATFPASVDPTQDITMNWTLAQSNQFQYVQLISRGSGTYQVDWDYKYIKPSARSHTFKGNTVLGYGPGTQYNLLLVQYNSILKDRVGFISGQWIEGIYNDSSRKTNDDMRELRKFLKQQLLAL